MKKPSSFFSRCYDAFAIDRTFTHAFDIAFDAALDIDVL